jgi:signal transduction histidine kinase/DNA-binding NarL/FixJ family response regulator
MKPAPSLELSYAEQALEYFYTRTYGGHYGARIGSILLVAGVSIYFHIISIPVAAVWLCAYAGCELTIILWWRRVEPTLGALTDTDAFRRHDQLIRFCAMTTSTAAIPFLLNPHPTQIAAVVSVLMGAGIVMIIAAQHSMSDKMFFWTAPVPAAAIAVNMIHFDHGLNGWIMAALSLCFVYNARQLQAANTAAEMAMVMSQVDADRASKAKSTFLATISHEIRTPLNGVLGMAQVMRLDELSPVQSERLDVVQRSGEALLALLNDVLDMSKIEAGRIELELTDFDLARVIDAACEAFAALTADKGVALTYTGEAAQGLFRGDPTRVRQIVFNLLSNAAKFTERGQVSVTAARTDAGLRLTVSDTGIGMTTEAVVRLFEKFSQADASTTRRFGGSGLGLSICRELCSLMGGTIAVESAPGEGSTFTVELPLLYVGPAAPASQAGLTNPGASAEFLDQPLRILVAEDNQTNQLVLRSLLQFAGNIEVEMVGDGALAVEAWETGTWDLILMDVNMPFMDGVTATRRIRSLEVEGARPRIPIIALTANAMTHQVAEYRSAGMDGHVAKPVDAAKLFQAMEDALGEGDGRDNQPPAALEGSVSSGAETQRHRRDAKM